MRRSNLSKYIAIAGAALLPAACQVGPAPNEASVYVSPADLSAGTMPATPTPPPPPGTLTTPDQTVTPHPLRSVPETFEEVAPRETLGSPPAPPAAPTRRDLAPTDHMPVLDQPAHDGMPSLHGVESDPMPVLTPSLTSSLDHEKDDAPIPTQN